MPGRVLVEIVRGQPPVGYDVGDLKQAIQSGLVAPMAFASVDDGASWVRAHEVAGLPSAEAAATQEPDTNAAVLRMVVPVGRSIWAIIAGYWGLFCLFFAPGWLAPILASPRAKPDVQGLLTVAGIALGVLVAPAAGFAALGHRAIRRDPKKHGMGRVVFAYVTAGLHFTLLLVAVAVSLVR